MAMVKKDILDLSIQKIPFAKVFISFAIGIILGKYVSFSSGFLMCTSLLCVLLILIIHLYHKVKFAKYIFSFSFYLFFISTACWLVNKNKPAHIQNYFDRYDSSQIIGTIGDEPIVKEKSIRFPIQVQAVLDSNKFKQSSGTIFITVMKDSIPVIYEYGDQIQIIGNYVEIDPPYNPEEFNYKQYLMNRGVYYQMFTRPTDIHLLHKDQGNWLISKSLKYRQELIKKFEKYIDTQRSFQIAVALIFGYRSQIDADAIRAFTNTGTIHVLSVSGLHVGLVFGFLSLLFSWMDRFVYGKLIRTILIIISIWAYVILTGMSPPILRAGIMITFFALSILFARKQIALNTLFASAFFIVLFAPNYLFDVGFQLSYCAILGIVLFYPLLIHLYVPKNKWLKYIVEYIYVSLAAQLFTLPLALYYFHQFPNYFLIANLFIAIPSTLVMYSGILLALIPIDSLSVFFGEITGWLLNILVDGLLIIEELPYAIEEGIYWDILSATILVAILMCIVIAFDRQNKITIWISTILSTVLVFYSLYHRFTVINYSGYRIYNLKSNVALAYINKGEVQLISNLDSVNHAILNYAVLPDLKRFVRSSEIDFLHIDLEQKRDIEIVLGKYKIWIVENLIDSIPNTIDYVLWRKNNKSDIAKLLISSKTRFILDGSNSNRTVNLYKEKSELDSNRIYVLKNNFAYVWDEN